MPSPFFGCRLAYDIGVTDKRAVILKAWAQNCFAKWQDVPGEAEPTLTAFPPDANTDL